MMAYPDGGRKIEVKNRKAPRPVGRGAAKSWRGTAPIAYGFSFGECWFSTRIMIAALEGLATWPSMIWSGLMPLP